MLTVEVIDTTNVNKLNIKAFQILNEHSCLANECSNEKYNSYSGNSIYYITNTILYDDVVIKEDAYFIGTYTYDTQSKEFLSIKIPSRTITVQVFSSIDYYQKNKDKFDKIRETNKKYKK